MLWDYSWLCTQGTTLTMLRDVQYRGCWGLNPGWPLSWLGPYLLYYLSSLSLTFKSTGIIIILSSMENTVSAGSFQRVIVDSCSPKDTAKTWKVSSGFGLLFKFIWCNRSEMWIIGRSGKALWWARFENLLRLLTVLDYLLMLHVDNLLSHFSPIYLMEYFCLS